METENKCSHFQAYGFSIQGFRERAALGNVLCLSQKQDTAPVRCYRATDELSPPHSLPRAPFRKMCLGFLIPRGKTV